MSSPSKSIQSVDPVWGRIKSEASKLILAEPLMGGMVHSSILHHSTFRKALSYRITLKLSSEEMPAQILRFFNLNIFLKLVLLSIFLMIDLCIIPDYKS